ncbi:MAG TPA: ribbon-helix-helix protein, CopG family [Methylomirabilota bacterium]|nr:ribbon-helix-helix protein, CopG family [Methylomirabilota bacterium]
MLRTQVQLTEAQVRRLRLLAERRGVSISQLVRDSVEQFLDAQSAEADTLYSRASEVVGAWDDRGGRDDLSWNHDEVLDEAFR